MITTPRYRYSSPTETSQALLWVEIKRLVFSVFCKNLQTSPDCMLIRHHSDSSDAQLIAKELCNHYGKSFIHHDTKEALELDKENSSNNWKIAI